MFFVEIDKNNRVAINELINNRWHSTDMVVRGNVVDMTKLDGLIAYEGENIIGLIMYFISENELEILSLDSFKENIGVGTELVKRIVDKANSMNCHKVKLITTNDNLSALKFYQKRGFCLAQIYRNSVNNARLLKPSIPLIGNDGIPLRDEIELELMIDIVNM